MSIEKYKLGDVCEITTGTSFKARDFTQTGTPVLKVKDIVNGKVETDNLFFCDLSKFRNSPKISYKDIVIAGGAA